MSTISPFLASKSCHTSLNRIDMLVFEPLYVNVWGSHWTWIAWINRAAKLGTMFPCVVPQGWIDPPSVEDDDAVRDRETLLPRE